MNANVAIACVIKYAAEFGVTPSARSAPSQAPFAALSSTAVRPGSICLIEHWERGSESYTRCATRFRRGSREEWEMAAIDHDEDLQSFHVRRALPHRGLAVR